MIAQPYIYFIILCQELSLNVKINGIRLKAFNKERAEDKAHRVLWAADQPVGALRIARVESRKVGRHNASAGGSQQTT